MPTVPVYSNVTGKPFESVEEIRASLVQQVVQPVRWESTISAMLAGGIERLYDLGPRATIKAMVRKISLPAWKQCQSIEV